jgi:hypothetical protein
MRLGDDFRDFAPLDPRLDAARWEGSIGRVMCAAEPELQRRASSEPRVLAVLVRWARPALSATAAVAAVAATLLVLEAGRPGSPEAASPGGALGYPQAFAEWMEVGVLPTLEEVVFSLEADSR